MDLPGPILVLDDDADDHEIIKMICSNLGIFTSILFFYEPHELLDYLENSTEAPFIILCDINMPLMNGMQLREIIHADKKLREKSIPFVFLSTSTNKQQVQRAYELSVQGFFVKGQSLAETERKLKIIFDYWLESKRPDSYR